MSYVTAGTGHRRAAEAIAEAARHHLPQAEVRCSDLLTETVSWVQRGYPRLYWLLVRYLPSWWALGYYAMDQPGLCWLLQPWRRRWNRWVARPFIRRLSVEQPDVVVATHFFSADVVAAAKRAGCVRAKLIVVITDLFPHRFWLVPEAEAFVVGSAKTREICVARGVPPDRVHVVGIPIGRAFRERPDRIEVRRDLGLDPIRWTILLVSGGMGVGPIAQIVRRLLEVERARPGQLQLVVVCGHNHGLKRQLDPLAARSAMPLHVFGFVETMPQVMAASDLMVTKAGGLSTMEALAMGLPMILCGNIPGQERLNAAFCLEQGAAISASHPAQVVEAVLRLYDHPDQWQVMRDRARQLGRPRAAEDIVELVVRSS